VGAHGAPRGGLGAFLTLAYTLTGCALSDPYFIDPNYQAGANSGGVGNTGRGGAAGQMNGGGTSGVGGKDAGAKAEPGGGGAGMMGPAGSCSQASCTGTCCGALCLDTASDPAHCGACDVACARGRSCSAGVCASGWVAAAPPPAEFVARERAASVAFSGKMFVFGGLDAAGEALNDAAIYDPASDSWRLVKTDAATPSPRQFATAMWTGSVIFVFGGRNAAGSTYFADGALYDPVGDKWSGVKDAPNVRAAANGGGDNKNLVVWGGLTDEAAAASGTERYDFSSDSWQSAPNGDGPSPVLGAGSAFSGASLYVYGGSDGSARTDRAYRYDLKGNRWMQLARGPAARSGPFAVWDGMGFFVWGGRTESALLDDGAVFESSWTAVPQGGPTARYALARQAGWAFALATGDVALLGGLNLDAEGLTDGARYRKSVGWSAIAAWPSGEAHTGAAAVAAAGEIVLWGGRDGTRLTRTGDRWAPLLAGASTAASGAASSRSPAR
jgi:hypothetical protein